MIRSPHLPGLPLLALLAACSGSLAGTGRPPTIDTLPGGIVRVMNHAPSDSGAWHLVPDHLVQPAEGAPGELLSPNDLALGDDGTLYVVDSKPAVIKVFDSTGAFVRTIGHEGDGPGEFRYAYIAISGDTLVAQDPRGQRAILFDARTGAARGQRMTVCCYFAPIAIDGRGRAVARVLSPHDATHSFQSFARFSIDGAQLDTVTIVEHPLSAVHWMVTSGGKRVFDTSVPLLGRDIHAVDPVGGFVTGWNGEYLLRTTRNGGDTVMLFGRRLTPEPVGGAEKQALVDATVAEHREDAPESDLRAAFDPAKIPDHRPAFEAIAVDRSGRRWIRLSTKDSTLAHFDLFDPSGRWLDHVTVPTNTWPRLSYQPNVWSRDHAAVLVEDAAGRPVVRVFRIEHRNR